VLSERILLATIALGLLGCVAGCNSEPQTPPQAKPAAAPAATSASTDDKLPGLAELSEADRKAAERQKICPVTGERLGSMGKPYKITVKGREIFLCCDGCKEAIEKDPDKYLKKLDP
jgi:Cu(I)/Ag(I) efflux system membrane fusion protein